LPAAAIAGTLFLLPTAGAPGQCQYEVDIIEAPECQDSGLVPATLGFGLNDQGHVVGSYAQCPTSDDEAFIWTAETGLITLPRPTGSQGARAHDINNSGQIVGHVEVNNRRHAMLWQGGQPIELGPLPGGNYSDAMAINNHGQIVGEWGNASDVTDLGVIPGGFSARAYGISENGFVVGSGRIAVEQFPFWESRALAWADSYVMRIDGLESYETHSGIHLTELGLIVGASSRVNGNPNITHAFIWQHGQTWRVDDLLLSPEGLSVSYPREINTSGQIVGWGRIATHAVATLLSPRARARADIDGDCRTGPTDLLIVLQEWGQPDSPADINDDGVVNVDDLTEILLSWEKPVTVTSFERNP
jgi:probable HAF family extracellular repeat protein